MARKCLHRLSSGSFCQRWAAEGSQFCSHHVGSRAHLQHEEAMHLHPLARLTTPEDVFDLLRETLNAARLGRITPGQAYAVGYLVSRWREVYQDLGMRQRESALHRQILPDLLVEEQQSESERTEAPHPLPVSVDGRAIIEHESEEPITPPLKHVSEYPGWIERHGRRKGDRPAPPPPNESAAESAPAAEEGSEVPAALAAQPAGQNGNRPKA